MKLYEKINKTQKEKRNWVSESESEKEKDLIFFFFFLRLITITTITDQRVQCEKGLNNSRKGFCFFLSLKYSMILSLYVYVSIYCDCCVCCCNCNVVTGMNVARTVKKGKE